MNVEEIEKTQSLITRQIESVTKLIDRYERRIGAINNAIDLLCGTGNSDLVLACVRRRNETNLILENYKAIRADFEDCAQQISTQFVSVDHAPRDYWDQTITVTVDKLDELPVLTQSAIKPILLSFV